MTSPSAPSPAAPRWRPTPLTYDVVFLFTTSAPGGPETFPGTGFSFRVVF